MLKKGTFIIIEKDGRFVAAVRRADGGVTELPEMAITPELQQLNGQACEYLFKGDRIVKVDGRNIFQAHKVEQPKPQQPLKPVQIDLKQALRQSAKEDESKVVEKMPKPNLQDSFDPSKSRVPNDTQRVKISKEKVDNFSLKLNQFARWDWQKDGNKLYFFNPKKIEEGPKNQKETKLEAFEIKANFGDLFKKDANQLADRQKAAAEALFSEAGHLIAQKFKPDWRFVTGLGGHSVYETGLTLHHVYGIPYIPASSVKGVLRSWVIFQKFGNDEKQALGNEVFCRIFGCPNESVLGTAHQGSITFFDALPTTPPKIRPDIMNSHYPKWYGGTGAPVDTDSPNPVFFLTVVDTIFEFLLGSKNWNLQTERFWEKTLSEWLRDALTSHGIGAKTAVGYGYFTEHKAS